MMKISFVIPVYNCIESLRQCVESIRAARVEDCEILLIDDGSTDGSGELCDALAASFPEVRAIHQENAGAAAARNRGLEEATGELLLFPDGDDTLDSEGLKALLSDPRCREADLTIFGMTREHWHKGCCYRRDTLFYPGSGALDWKEEFEALFRENMLSPLWNKVFRREIIRKYDLELDTSLFLYEDFAFVLRYLRYCDTIWNVPRPIYRYRAEEGKSQKRIQRLDSIPEYLQSLESALAHLPEGVSRESRDAVLQQLYDILFGQKAAVSALRELRCLCSERRKWAEARNFPSRKDGVLGLYLGTRLTRLRHRIAVGVKTMGKGRAYGH